MAYWNVILVSDTRSQPPDMSVAFQDFLPYLFICYFFWRGQSHLFVRALVLLQR